jgi:surfeit locus 1 family protein
MSEPTSPPAQRFPIGLTVAVLIALAILLTLGSWQLKRLQHFTDLKKQIAAQEGGPPLPVETVLAGLKPGSDAAYSRVSLVCPDVETRPVLRLFVPNEGLAGYRLIAACPLKSGPYGYILVDRGFIAQLGDENPRDIPGQPISAPVVGVLHAGGQHNFVTPPNTPAVNQWYWRDIPAMAKALHAPRPALVFLMLESPVPSSGEPRPIPVERHFPNNLGYAITWFGLAGALIGVYLGMLLRKRQN